MKNKMIKKPLIIFLSALPLWGFSQTEEVVGEIVEETVVSLGVFDYLLFATAGLLVIGAIWAVINLMKIWVRMREIEIYEQNGFENYRKEKEAKEVSWINSFLKSATAAVPIAREKEILMSHDYDGIQELDNNLPPWWLYGFYLTIGIAIFYMGYFHFSSNAKSSHELYEEEMAAAKIKVDAFIAKQANQVDENTVVALVDAEDLAEGKTIFDENCIACHLEHGGGSSISVGPNLTDKYWIHGGGIKNIFKTVKNGVPEKGMIAWKTQLRPAEIHKVSSYIMTLEGTNPADAKEPQGDLYEETETENTPEESEVLSENK